MRISDWSSDVCSSDLLPRRAARYRRQQIEPGHGLGIDIAMLGAADHADGVDGGMAAQPLHRMAHQRAAEQGPVLLGQEIGRASCRARVCSYVEISVDAGSWQKKKIQPPDKQKH